MDVYWLEQTKSDLPAQDHWLSAGDLDRLSGMRFEKRRADWQLGRWTAKRALAAYLHLPTHLHALAKIEIRPAPGGAPEVYLASQPAEVTISLSHRAGAALCVIGVCGSALGCDLEIAEPRSDAFVSDYFTTEEQELVARANVADRAQLLAILWSAKESALKALGVGLRLDTRCVAVCPLSTHRSDNSVSEWHPLHVRVSGGPLLQGWWRDSHDMLRTMVANPSPGEPIALLDTSQSFDGLGEGIRTK